MGGKSPKYGWGAWGGEIVETQREEEALMGGVMEMEECCSLECWGGNGREVRGVRRKAILLFAFKYLE